MDLGVAEEYEKHGDVIEKGDEVKKTLAEAMAIITEGTVISVRLGMDKKKSDKSKAKKVLQDALGTGPPESLASQ